MNPSSCQDSRSSFFPHGLIAAVHSPFDASGELDLAIVEKQATRFVRLGAPGVFVGGTTGECYSLDVEERCRLARRWCEVARGSPLQVFVHVGHCTQREAITMAREAAAAGAAGIAAMAPFYQRPETTALLIEFLRPIASAAQLPFFYYDIPHLTHVRLPVREVVTQAKAKIPEFAGIKYTNPDLMQFQQCVQLSDGKLALLHGFDETLLAGIALGATGAIGTTYNFAVQLYRKMLQAVAAGDWETARTYQRRSVEMIEVLNRWGFSSAAKAVMEYVGVSCGPPRPPLRPLLPHEKAALFDALESLDVLDPRDV